MLTLILTIVLVILGVWLLVCFGMVGYLTYQLRRNDAVYKIRVNWINTDDNRYQKYSYDYMFDPNRINWFGLKFPKDEHFR